MRKMKVAITCLMCVDEAIGLDIASLPFFRELILDGSFEAVQCLFAIFSVWTKASCIHNRRYVTRSVGGENLIFPGPFTLTITVNELSVQACYLLLPRCEPCMHSLLCYWWAMS